jgi:ketosteroid isomerase-like protein
MTATQVKTVIAAFVEAINAHDADALERLMTDDHLFVDSLGSRVVGAGAMIAGWRHYFAMFPDYRIDLDNILTEGSDAMLHGSAHGTLYRDGAPVLGGAWTVAAAWRVVVSGGKISLWQVYADNKQVHDLLERHN